MSIFNPRDDEKAIEQGIDYCKQKLIEAGAELIKLAGDEAEGFTVTCTFTATFSRKAKE